MIQQSPPTPCGEPFSPCWCEEHPNNPNCPQALPTVPTLLPLILVALVIGLVYKTKIKELIKV